MLNAPLFHASHIDKAMKELDRDGDGTVDFAEFEQVPPMPNDPWHRRVCSNICSR
jgi:hypothetical protein